MMNSQSKNLQLRQNGNNMDTTTADSGNSANNFTQQQESESQEDLRLEKSGGEFLSSSLAKVAPRVDSRLSLDSLLSATEDPDDYTFNLVPDTTAATAASGTSISTGYSLSTTATAAAAAPTKTTALFNAPSMMSTTTTTGNNSSVLPSKRLVPPANLFQPQQKPPLGSSGEYPYPFTRQYNHHNQQQQQQQQQRQYATPQQTDLSAGGINPSSSDNNSPSLTPPSSQSMTDPQQLPYTLGTLAAGGDDRRNSTISVLSMHSFGSGMTGEQKPNGLISRQQSSSIEDLAAVLSLPNQRDQQTAEAINALVSLTGTVPLTAAQQQQQKQQQQQQEKQRRHRRKFDEVERLFRCNFGTCQKSYGTLNHLNHHIVLQGHGPKRKPSEFPEIRRYLKEKHRHSSQIASADISDTASEPSLPQPLQPAQLQQQ